MKHSFAKKRILLLVAIGMIVMLGCTDKKNVKKTEMQPVESDEGIGDGAPSLDSLLQKPIDTLTQN